MHYRISSSINRILTYCESNNVDVIGVARSIVVGLCIGVSVVVALGVFPGKPMQNCLPNKRNATLSNTSLDRAAAGNI
jgi:hypothetical protein